MIESLNTLDQSIFDEVITLDIDCEQLASLEMGCHGTSESDKVFEKLHNNGMNGRPAIYWFEITSDHTAEMIRNSYSLLKERIGSRTIPAINKVYDRDSKVLYVGKGQANISGRMFLHLGYQKMGQSQGLQLSHWDYLGELKGLKLRINIIYLPAEMKALCSVYELKIAQEFHPILGKHR